MPLYYPSSDVDGSDLADFMFIRGNGTNHGLGGNDVLIGDSSYFYGQPNPGGVDFANATNIDLSSVWFTEENPLVANDAVPWTRVYMQGVAASGPRYFSVTVEAGQTITIDVDYGYGTTGSAVSVDSIISLYNPSQVAVASDDDSTILDGGLGSISAGGGTFTYDSFLVYTATVSGTYYFTVGEFGGTFEGDEELIFHVSVGGHATSAYSSGNDILAGGAGDDQVFGMGGNDTLYGGIGNDFLHGGTGGDSLFGDDGNDELFGGGGADQLVGGIGTDTIRGNGGNDALFGGNDDDILLAGGGADELLGGTGNDRLDGGSGADAMNGGSGDDVYVVDNAGDTVTELANDGTDTVRSNGLNVTLGANIERLIIASGSASGTGNELDNAITGSNGNNTLSGLNGNDVIRGLLGTDTLIGGLGADWLYGGLAKDTLTGGAGADRFFYDTTADSSAGPVNADVITDFSHAQGDRIGLAQIDANTATVDNDAFVFVGTANFSFTAGELRYRYDGNGNTLIQVDVDGDAVSDMSIVLTGEHALVAADFIL